MIYKRSRETDLFILSRLPKDELINEVMLLRETLRLEQNRRICSDIERGSLLVEVQLRRNKELSGKGVV
jgi:hypothetical protein